MPQDAFTLKYLCEELNEIFSGGKVNRIVQPGNDEVIFTVYTGKRTERLLIDVNPAAPRIGVLGSERESPLTAPNFCMLLRKHLSAATLDGIALIGFDRIVKIDFTASGEFFDAEKKTLYVELMGRYSNIILTENGKILGGNRGINMFDNGVRPLIVGKPYLYPPVGGKKTPDDPCLINYYKNYSGGELAAYICGGVQGLAVSTAKEILTAFAAYKGVSEDCVREKFTCFSDEFFDFSVNFLYSAKKNPCVFKVDGRVADVCLFPYENIRGERVFFPELYLAEEYFYTEKNAAKRFADRRDRIKSVVNTAVKKVKKRLTAINAKRKEAESAEENRIKGELIIANIYRLKQGEDRCVLENYYDGGSAVEIALDPRLSPSKNAESYYKKYNKQKRTLAATLPQKDAAQSELEYLESVLDEIALCETESDLDHVYEEATEYGLIRDTRPKKKIREKTVFCRVYDIDGFIVRVGRNNAENDRLTAAAKPESLWLHAKDCHSSHVVIEFNGRPFPQSVIAAAAEICAYYSKDRESGKTEIAYTEKKNVRKPKKSPLGFCTYDNYKTVTVRPARHAEFLNSD